MHESRIAREWSKPGDVNDLGFDYLDAPVSGGEVGAKAANLTIMVGGPQDVFERVKPLFASKAGADPARVRQALMGGFAASLILEVHGERMIERTFDPGFRIALHQKDLGLTLAGAQGWGQLDHSALVKALEHMAAHEVAAAPQ